MLRTRNCKQKQKSHFGRFHYLALCDFFGTTHKISSRYKTLSSFVQILAILRFLNKISRLFRKWCEKHKKAVIARFYAVKSWRHKRSGFCVAKMCCEPLGEAKSTTHAVRSPLPCGGGWGWVFCGENSTNPTPSRTAKSLCVAKFAPKFSQNSTPTIFGVR